MAAGGLTKFIHGTQHDARAGQRIVPKKLDLDNVDRIYKSKNSKTSNGSTGRGAFSTDLGSYPDTSLDEDQNGLVEPRQSRLIAGRLTEDTRVLETKGTGNETNHDTGTVISVQHREQPIFSDQKKTSDQLDQREATISALIGAGNFQQFENFLQTWSSNNDQIEELPEKDERPVLSGSANNVPKTALQLNSPVAFVGVSARPEAIENPRNTLPLQQTKPNSSTMVIPNISSRQPFFRQPQKIPAHSLFQSQSTNQASELTSQHRELSYHTSDSASANDDHIIKTMPQHTPLPPAQHVPVITPFEEQASLVKWKLKRPAELRDIRLDIPNQQLSSKKSPLFDNESSKPKGNDTFFTNLNRVLNDISSQNLDEETLFSHLSCLDQDQWCNLGDEIQSKIGGITNELKQLYTEKKGISLKYEQEIEIMMRQIGSNEKVVTNKLQKLRSFGARVLREDAATEES